MGRITRILLTIIGKLMQRRAFLGLMSSVVVNTAFGGDLLLQDDIYVSNNDLQAFKNVLSKLKLVSDQVGHGNFSIISFDEVLKIARRHSSIGAFGQRELEFIDKLFYEDIEKYGFYGKRTCFSLTEAIKKTSVVKIPKTGNYLFKGEPLDTYEKIIKDIGSTITLTSGVRGIPKQLYLYMNKIKNCKGNISLASNSIAPPGHSYHSIGDYDVGKKGWGHKNFTESFVLTEEFNKLRKLEYISMRYKINNEDGVRFEPWHIKII